MPRHTTSTSTTKSDAEVLRLGLITGLVDVPTIVAWADQQVLADRADDAPVLLDLSLASRKSVADLVSLLGEVPGDIAPAVVGRRLAGELAARFLEGEIGIVVMARAMYRIVREGYAPDEEFEWAAYAADDGVDLALQGTYGTLAAVAQDVGEFLQRYESGATAMPPAA